jgi:hypothetical protein
MIVALAAVLALQLGPWTGADLPTAAKAGAIRYRITVTAPPGTNVHLRASGLPHAWVASFCTARVCAPFAVELHVADSGTGTIEFAVIPDNPASRAAAHVTITATEGATRAQAAVVAQAPPLP